MAAQQIGLQAIFDDKDFQAGMARYTKGVQGAESLSTRAARGITTAFSGMSSGLSGAFSAVGNAAKIGLVAGVGAATAALGALSAASFKGIQELNAWAGQLDALGDQFGMTGEQASGFSFLANKVGLSVDEMGMGLNNFTRQLAELKPAMTQMVSAKTPEQIARLKQQLEDANTQLSRARERFSGAKKPTDAMKYAVEDAQKKVARLNAEIAAGGKLIAKTSDKETDFSKALKDLGVRAFDSKGKLRTFDDVLPDIMDKFKKLPPGINASALAMQLFGARGGSKFLDFLRQGSDGLEDARAAAKAFGLEISSEESDAVEEFGFAMNELGLALKGAWVTVGRAALPIVREFVGVIIRNMPRVTQLIKAGADWFIKNAMPQLRGAASWAVRTFIPLLQQVADSVGRLFGAFQTRGFSGLFDELGRQLSAAFKGFDAAKVLGDFGGAVAGALSAAWARISPELGKWGGRFWSWLTGKGGALEQASAQLGKVVSEIARWVGTASNIDPIVNTMRSWVTQFWWWLTNPTSGAIVVVAENMAKLAERIEKWTQEPETIKRIQDIGATVAKTIIQGIGNFFASDSTYSQNAFMQLAGALDRARRATSSAFASIASALASGFIGEIAEFFKGEEAANRIKDGLYTALTWGIKKLLEGGTILNTVMNLGIEMGKAIIKGLTLGIVGGAPDTTTGTSGFGGASPGPNYYWDPASGTWKYKGKTYASGGWVTQTAPALLHAGEYVLNRAQVRAMMPMLASQSSTTNNYSFNHTWTGNMGGVSRSEIETIVRTATFQSMQTVLARG